MQDPISTSDGPILFGSLGERRWGFLSNFFPASFSIDGKMYATVEHYYQACKAPSEEQHERIRTVKHPAKAKRLGRKIELAAGWDDRKIVVMRRGLVAKFQQHPELAAQLIQTGDRPIHEASRYDGVWGWMDGEGEDLLGKLLMEIRGELRHQG